ncbi:MAG: helix-turn-helix transcriptional regulator [Thermoplasmata archaeon]|nr:helix-turn-helix transcriptional regulator [Thermoplasmata archaeon]
MRRPVSGSRPNVDSYPLSSIGTLLREDALGCPIRASLGILGRKWALVVLRDVAFWPDQTFGQLLARSEGLTPRVLTNRLRELRSEELIEKLSDPHDDRKVHYRLTSKGKDVVPVLMALSAFGLRHLAPQVTPDGKTRTLAQTFPGLAPVLLRDLYEFALTSRDG